MIIFLFGLMLIISYNILNEIELMSDEEAINNICNKIKDSHSFTEMKTSNNIKIVEIYA